MRGLWVSLGGDGSAGWGCGGMFYETMIGYVYGVGFGVDMIW